MRGQYYVHVNGDLIYKPHGGVEHDSPFVVSVWSVDQIGQSPQAFTHFLHEAYQLGAREEYISELAIKNNLGGFIPNWREQVFGEDTT